MEETQTAPAPTAQPHGLGLVPAAKTKLVQVPSVGRIVHYVDRRGIKHWPAIIVDVLEPGNPTGPLTLRVFAGNSDTYLPLVTHRHDGLVTRTWHWPEPVPPIEIEVTPNES